MREMPPREHWLDRLAVRQTRRQVLKAALAGVALTVPVVPAARAAVAADPNGCRKGCEFTAHSKGVDSWNSCASALDVSRAHAAGVLFYVNPFFAAAVGGVGYIRAATCLDRAVLTEKAAYYDCAQPGCSGFDPKAPGGPCETCNAYCNLCQASSTGYICCAYPADDPKYNCCPA